MIDSVQPLPQDLGPEAIGLSKELVKQCQTEESVDVCCLQKSLSELNLTGH